MLSGTGGHRPPPRTWPSRQGAARAQDRR
jgi:hypothetical protein